MADKLSHPDGIRFLFGCENEMDKYMTLGISGERFDELDFIVITTAIGLQKRINSTYNTRSKSMTYNYHTHTHRCGHATGEMEEYILRAIEGGITHMGFSDHIPLMFNGGRESEHRVPCAEGKVYCDEIKALAEKYKDKIEIAVGFEAEYYPEYFDVMLENARKYGAEYLILGQHYTEPEGPGTPHSVHGSDRPEALKKYVDSVVAAMKTGVFTYVAHPDVFRFVGDDEVYIKEMKRICTESAELGIPLEINFLGIRDKRSYPREEFWKIAGKEGCPVTFGFDAHNVQSAYDGESVEKAMELVKKCKLNYIGKAELVHL